MAKSHTAFGPPLIPSLANLEFLYKTKLAQGPGSRNFSGRQKPQTADLLIKGLEMGPFKCLRAQRPGSFHFWPPRHEFLSTTSFHDSRSLVLFFAIAKVFVHSANSTKRMRQSPKKRDMLHTHHIPCSAFHFLCIRDHS